MKKNWISAGICGLALGFYCSIFAAASAPSEQETKAPKASAPPAAPADDEKMAAMVKQQAILNMIKKCKNWEKEKAALMQEIEDLKKQVAQLQEQLASSAQRVRPSKSVKRVKRAGASGDSVEQIQHQLEIFNKAYEYMAYRNARGSRVKNSGWRANQALKAMDRLIALYPNGSYVQEMKELVRSPRGARGRSQADPMKGLLSIKDRLLADLNKIRKDAELEKMIQARQAQEEKPVALPVKSAPVEPEEPKQEVSVAPKQEKPQEEEEDDDE